MRVSSLRYIAVLHQIQHTIFELETGNIDEDIAANDVNDVARLVPGIDREWRKEIGQ